MASIWPSGAGTRSTGRRVTSRAQFQPTAAPRPIERSFVTKKRETMRRSTPWTLQPAPALGAIRVLLPRETPDGRKTALTGTIFMVDDFREDQILIPFPMTKLRFWRNCAIAATPSGGTGSLVKHYLGYEWDESPDNGFRPPGLIHLSLTTLVCQYLLARLRHPPRVPASPPTASPSIELREVARSSWAGTVMWAWGLDPNHDPDLKDTTQTPDGPQRQTGDG